MNTRPIEVSKASMAVGEAWGMYDVAVENNDQVGIDVALEAVDILQEHFGSLYRQWQILGGTSDIDSITMVMFPVEPTPAERKAEADKVAEEYERQYIHNPRERTPDEIEADDIASNFNFDAIKEIPF